MPSLLLNITAAGLLLTGPSDAKMDTASPPMVSLVLVPAIVSKVTRRTKTSSLSLVAETMAVSIRKQTTE